MASLAYEIESDALKVKLEESASHKIFVSEITDKTTGTVRELFATTGHQTFSIVLRPLSDEGGIITVDPSTADIVGPSVKEELSDRWRVSKTFKWLNVWGGTSDHFHAEIRFEILDSQPDRLRVDLRGAFDDYNSDNECIYFMEPYRVALPQLGGAYYFNAHNGGIVTPAPATDLIGDGAAYRFNRSAQYAPETFADTETDTFETLYPTYMSVAASGLASPKSGQAFLFHDEFGFRLRRFLDSYDATSGCFVFASRQLMDESLIAYNKNQSDLSTNPTSDDWMSAVTYVSFFKMTGDIVGEEMGLNWRKWFLSAAETQAYIPSKARDRADMPQSAQYPLWLMVGTEDIDDGDANDTTRKVYAELRAAFPGVTSFDKLPRYARDLLDYADDATTGYDVNVDDIIPEGWDQIHDAAKAAMTDSLRDVNEVFTLAEMYEHQPVPFDGAGDWAAGLYGAQFGGRVKNHLEMEDGSYKDVEDWIKVIDTQVGASTYNGITDMTTITLTSDLDDDLWDLYSTSNASAHSLHADHLGYVTNDSLGPPESYVMERRAAGETKFKSSKQIEVAGDQRVNFSNLDNLSLYFLKPAYLPGYSKDGSLGDADGTMLCPWADAFASGAQADDKGHYSRLYERLLAHLSGAGDPGVAGYLSRGQRTAATCFESTHTVDGQAYSHAQGDASIQLGWRAGRNYLRSLLIASHTDWEFYDDYGPHDWLIGESDGFVKTTRRQDIASSNGSWAPSPFFVTALGDYMRMGWYEGGNNLGHVSTLLGETLWVTVAEGTSSGAIRESMTWDWLQGRKLISLHCKMDVSSKMGSGSGAAGADAYTPFFHSSAGYGVNGTLSRMMAQMIQVQEAFSFSNFQGARMRSLERLNLTTRTTLSTLYSDGHDLPIVESGSSRPTFQHAVFQRVDEPRKIVAVLVNDQTSDGGDSYRFRSSWYDKQVPGGVGAFRVTKYTFRHDGWDTEDLGVHKGDFSFSAALLSSEIVAYEFHFESGLRFIYAYDDDDDQEVPIPLEGARSRVEDIHGHGERIQVGFKSDLPDEEVEVTSIHLRLRGLGRSEGI